MKALAILALCAGVAAADAPRATALGFDHIFHDRNLVVKGGDALPCGRCHTEKQGKLVGKPTHASCFGACHGAAPTAPKKGSKIALGDRAKVCTSCHAEAALAKPYPGKLAVFYPPYSIDPDFNITLGHKQHAATACVECHDMRTGAGKPAAHQRCAGCHDGSRAKGPAMSACASCHPRAVGKPQPPELAAVRDTVTAVFSHAKHAARGATGKDCATCHAGVRATNDTELPRPTVKDCASCHDGKSAFATSTACTRCHDKPSAEIKFDVARPQTRFSHAGEHADIVKKRACVSCHPLSAKGEISHASHAVCAECHAADFGLRQPAICGACHNATEPWRHLVADRPPPDQTEFGATLDHGKHRADCTSCHRLRTAVESLRTPRGHVACAGAGCHATKGGPMPTFDRCDGCHRLGLARERLETRTTAPWSVRAMFGHDPHARLPDGKPLACTSCHDKLDGNGVLALPTPKKPACAPCHDDGKAAFKLTGTTCKRCHAGART